jgi:hypothetical protein
MSEFGRWLKSVFRHWILSIGCAGVAAFQLVYGIWQQSWPPVITWLILLVCLCAAVFLAWRDEHRKALALEERIKPKMKISGGRSVDKCFIWGGDIFYFRARLESLGVDHIHKVEAHITEIRKDGEPVELKEVAQLMMHPGCPTLPVLKHKVTGFIDVIKTDLNTQPVLALAWNYASVEADIVASGDTYEIDIAVSAESVPTQTCTFVFAWSGHPFTSKFEMIKDAQEGAINSSRLQT